MPACEAGINVGSDKCCSPDHLNRDQVMIKTRVHRDLCVEEHDEEKDACGDLF